MIPDTLKPLAVSIDSLRPYPKNPRNGDLAAIKESLRANQQYRPVVVNRGTRPEWSGEKNTVLAGNHTYFAMMELGASEIAATFGEWSDEEAARIVLVDNRTNDLAKNDDALIAEILQDLPEIEGTGYTDEALDELLRSLAEPGPAEEEPDEVKGAELREKWGVEPGQLWTVGEHCYLCGDNGDMDAVARVLDGKPCEAVVTDPPYEISAGAVMSAVRNFADMAVVLSGTEQAFSLARDGWRYRLDFAWRHRRPRSFPTKHQPVYYHHNIVMLTYGERKLGWRRPEPSFGSVIELQEAEFEKSEMGHAKSPDLFVQMLRGFADKTWADPYAGSGASLLACEALGKKMVAVEISPETTAVALQRFEDAGLRCELADV